MTDCFLDTGYLLALELKQDQHHEAARPHWEATVRGLSRVVTTTYVFDEVVTFLSARGHHRKAVQVGQRLLASQLIEVVSVTPDLFKAGWERLQARPDKRYSLTDCLSFVVMERRGLAMALAFDHHFEQEGFQIAPSTRPKL
jgi:hypothetical protein